MYTVNVFVLVYFSHLSLPLQYARLVRSCFVYLTLLSLTMVGDPPASDFSH